MVAVIVTVFAAAVQGSIGAGYAILAVPVLALIDPVLAPVPQLLASLPLSVGMLWRERADVDVPGMAWIIAGRIPGLLLGIWVLAVASRNAIFAVIAGLILAMVVAMAAGLRIPRNPGTEFGAGVVSGTSGLVASVGGPPLALLYRDERGPTIRSTLAALFTIGLVLSVVGRGVTGNITGDDVVVGTVLLFPTLAGFLISTRLLSRIEDRLIRTAILVISGIAALALLVRSVT